MEQAEYRSVYNFRQALMRLDDGSVELIFVDDKTFDPAVHEEIPAEEPKPE